MDVALCIERFEETGGGAERYAYALSRALAAAGHGVTVLCLRGDAPPAGVAVEILPVPSLPWGLKTLRFARAVERACEGGRFAIVHSLMKSFGANVFHPHTGSHAASVAARIDAEPGPLSRSLHRLLKSLSFKQRVFGRIERRQYAMAPPGLFVAVSARVRDDMVGGHGVDPARVRVLHNGVDLGRFSPAEAAERVEARRRAGVEDGEFCLLFAAHNFPLKGLGTLIRALARLPEEARDRLRCLVAGRDRPGPYRRLGDRLGLAERIRFLGPVADMVPLYRAADLFALPTFYDPCSLTVLEAMACGTPVVTSARNGAAELFPPAADWVLADPADAEGLARLVAGLADPAAAEEARAQLAALRPVLAWERHFQRMVGVYEEVLAGA